ncbi:two-component response regulator [Dehalogenimonas sp. WBC-2]|nr:two-component response regulator [Dehalogenimonas sp. WBC-2]
MTVNTNRCCRVLLVDDHQIAREGLKRILVSDRSIEVVGEAGNGSQAITMAGTLFPDVITMDIRMPGMDGIAATRQIVSQFPSAKVVMLSLFADDHVQEAFEAGASGFILKESDSESIIEAVHQANNGYYPVSPVLIKRIISDFPALLMGQKKDGGLTGRHLEVLRLISEGYNSKQIATMIFTSQSTAKREIRQILQILQAKDRAQAVSKAVQRGII